jgi:hypothetical protein
MTLICQETTNSNHEGDGTYPSCLKISFTIASWRDKRCIKWFATFVFLLWNYSGECQFQDVRNIISDDDLLQEGILPALREYNIEQFTVVDVPDTDHQASLFYT